ncbi:hypothetical protein J1605_021485 [Eschrichtius robustus]|uniref:Uncharacterized protein n=1 Tax=Eschrichtius robustus TaxID=9764 RepID=A0AB34HGR9_ESCRO|nr:hypothetical protein J1605_021485 [Eschrichtius robustus]
MECPHLSSSVCIAPDSAKFPNGSPSSWCCSGECGPRRPCSAPEAPALPGLPSRGRGQSARGLGERSTPGEREPGPREVLRTRAAEVGVFHQPGKVKFENRLRAEKAQKAD